MSPYLDIGLLEEVVRILENVYCPLRPVVAKFQGSFLLWMVATGARLEN